MNLKVPQHRPSISTGQIAHTQTTQQTPATAPAPAQKPVQGVQPDIKASVPKETAKEFVQSSTGPRTGQSVFATRVKYSETTMGMAETAWKDFGKAEKKMDGVAKELTKGWDPADQKDMAAEQNAFKAYARSQGAFQAFHENTGGSIWRIESAGIAQQMVEARMDFLKKGAEVPGNSKAKIPDTAPQQEMNALIYESFNASKSQLQTLRDKISEALEDPTKSMFEEAEKAFDAFRDATAERVANGEARGGTLAPAIWGSVAEGMTDKHHDELIKLLDSIRSGGQG